MKNTLYYIISHIVDKPEEVTIAEEAADGVVNFTITVDKEDMGKVIGKEGKIIRSIRNVMKIPAMKQNVHINVALIDPAIPQE